MQPEHDDAATIEWSMMSARATGSRHVKRNEPCQDALAVTVLPNGTLIAAVSDGAGSAQHSETGSALVIEAIMTALTDLASALPTEDDALHRAMRTAFRSAYFSLVAHADEAGIPLESLHATLSCVILTDQVAVMGQVGDGAIAIAHEDGLLELGLPAQKGEYANSTCFVTQYPQLNHIFGTRVLRDPVLGVGLMTDGLVEIAFNDPFGECVPFSGFLGPLFRELDANNDHLDDKLRKFLDRPLIRDRTSDDLSLILALRTDMNYVPVHSPELPPPAPDEAEEAGETEHANEPAEAIDPSGAGKEAETYPTWPIGGSPNATAEEKLVPQPAFRSRFLKPAGRGAYGKRGHDHRHDNRDDDA